jgi:hypothetical protein
VFGLSAGARLQDGAAAVGADQGRDERAERGGAAVAAGGDGVRAAVYLATGFGALVTLGIVVLAVLPPDELRRWRRARDRRAR